MKISLCKSLHKFYLLKQFFAERDINLRVMQPGIVIGTETHEATAVATLNRVADRSSLSH